MHAPLHPQSLQRVDIEFNVPCVHRLRFTNNCFGSDWPLLAELFELPVGMQGKVQIWMDEGLGRWDGKLAGRIESLFGSLTGLELVAPVFQVAGGEAIKNDPQFVDGILREIDRFNLDRRSYVVVVGGGAVLDAVGFAAAIAHRGIRLIRIPTTTLAQADSGVGVKNAVNAFQKKNWKGTFAVPWGVVNDEQLLHGLSDRDFRCGFSEAVKVSLLKSPSAFQQLMSDADSIASRNMPMAMEAIRASVMMHLQHITQGGDPFEALEARPLDFGHWSAHRLEALTGYQLRHGEAVSIGLAVDTAYSSLALGLPTRVVEQTLDTLSRLRLPIYDPWLDRPEIFQGLEEFRQHLGGRLTLTMIQQIGQPVEIHEVDQAKMRQAISWVREAFSAATATS